jgi:hypothetical protein
MAVEPALTPVTTPPITVAMAVLSLVHVPPGVVDDKVVVTPRQFVRDKVPVMGATTGSTQGTGTVVTLLTGLEVHSQVHLVYTVIGVEAL